MTDRDGARLSWAGCQLVLALVCATGCVTQHGGPWRRAASRSPAAAPTVSVDAGAPSIVVLGELGATGPTAAAVADRLDATLQHERVLGRTPIVLWLGESDAARKRDRCGSASELRGRNGPDALVAVLDAHRKRGGAAYAVAGESATVCGGGTSDEGSSGEVSASAAGLPFEHPAPHYIVTVAGDGQSAVTLTCTATGCVASGGPSDPVAQLVFVDIAPWIATLRPANDDPTLVALDHLADTLDADAGQQSVPRILVSHYPVEAAGYQGLGGGDPDSTIHNWPARLEEIVLRGGFVGALGSHDRSTYATADIASALKRADRRWIPAPMFQVVSGAASAPDALARNAYRRLRYFNAGTYLPAAFTPRAGFAVVRLNGTKGSVSLHAKRGRGWQTALVRVSLAPAPKPELTASPSMAQCLRCPARPYSERP